MSSHSFVARERELGQLEGFLSRAMAGQGQVAFVMGEAGSGKSALLAEFGRRAEVDNPELVVATGTCNAQTGIGDPYLPFREILAQLTGDAASVQVGKGISPENARRLESMVRWTCEALVDLGPDLIDILVPGSKLLGMAGAFVLDRVGWPEKLKKLVESKAALPSAPALEQGRIFEQTTEVLKALAARRPLVLALDDLHWADSASVSLLFHLGRRIGESRILVLGAYRPEEVGMERGNERHPLEKVLAEFKRYYGDVQVDLDQAERDEARQFVDALVDLEPNRLGPRFRRLLMQHTGGHPLFAVELLRHMQEQGDLRRDTQGRWVEAESLDWDALPPRVEGVIEERISRLEDQLQETLRIASVEGEQFTAEVVARVRQVQERALVGQLSNELDRQHHLVMAQGIRRLSAQPLSSYSFRHSLFQKYLYDGLDEAERAYLHEDVGKALEMLYGEQAGEIAVHLARHYEEAGLAEKAIQYLRRAAEQAVRASANTEAIGHLTRALTMLQTLPPGPARDRLELPLQMGLATTTIIVKGWAAPGVGSTLERARELCREAELTPELLPVLRILYTHLHAMAEHRAAYELAEQLVSMAEEVQDPMYRVMAYQALGQSQTEMGNLVAGRAALEHALAYHDPQQHRTVAYRFGEEHGVSARLNLGLCLFILGYPDRAMAVVHEGLVVAEALAHPHVLAYTLFGMGTVHLLRSEIAESLVYTERALHLCAEHGIPFWRATLSISHGYAIAVQGRLAEGIDEATQGLGFYRAIGARVLQTVFLVQLAEMRLLAGQVDEGLAIVNEGLAAASDTEERVGEAELYRLRAELQRMKGFEIEAEADLHRALEISRAQQSRSWELRATLSLCRLWRDQGKHAEARQRLADSYAWFTEGFDTPDLQDARTLLAELEE